MRPIFTIHAGEFIFGEEVEKLDSRVRLWLPTKDTGVDFLLTSEGNENCVSVQVKMSRDYRPNSASSKFEEALEAAGWFVFSAQKLKNSKANVWSLVLVSRERRSRPYFVNIPPAMLLKILESIHGKQDSYHLYVWVLSKAKLYGDKKQSGRICIEGRKIKKTGKNEIAAGDYVFGDRDLTPYLDCWDFLTKLLVDE